MTIENDDYESESKTIPITAEIANSLIQYMDYLIDRGYYLSREDVVRQAILDLFIDKFEISLMDLEPDIFEYPSLEDISEDETD